MPRGVLLGGVLHTLHFVPSVTVRVQRIRGLSVLVDVETLHLDLCGDAQLTDLEEQDFCQRLAVKDRSSRSVVPFSHQLSMEKILCLTFLSKKKIGTMMSEDQTAIARAQIMFHRSCWNDRSSEYFRTDSTERTTTHRESMLHASVTGERCVNDTCSVSYSHLLFKLEELFCLG